MNYIKNFFNQGTSSYKVGDSINLNDYILYCRRWSILLDKALAYIEKIFFLDQIALDKFNLPIL